MRALNELLRSDLSARDEYLMRVELHTRLASEPDLFLQSADAVAGAGMPDFSLGDRCRILLFEPGGAEAQKETGASAGAGGLPHLARRGRLGLVV